MTQLRTTLSPEYSRSFGRAAVVIFLLLVLGWPALEALHQGLPVPPWNRRELTVQITLMAAMGYLGGVAVMAVRRPHAPTAADVWLLRWGFVPLWLAAQVGVRYAWSWMGRL